MDIGILKELSFDEIRALYKEYLLKQNISSATVGTAYSDSFYLWRHGSKELFWDVVSADDFGSTVYPAVTKCLAANSKGADIAKLASGYVSHLNRFRAFLDLQKQTDTDVKAAPSVQRSLPVTDSGRKTVPVPSPAQVEIYLRKWSELENYRLQEDALNRLFFDYAPKNNDISDILLKVSALNDFYSTNIYSTYPVAKHILELDVDDRLKAGDVTLVNDIKTVCINGKTWNFYSFASKYCSHHNPFDYPIYDSYVDEVLRYFRNTDSFSAFSNEDLKNYVRFKGILIDFRKYYGLEKYNLKQIDQYLWQLGKEHFTKNYGKNG